MQESRFITALCKFYYDPDDVQAKIEEAKADGEELTEENAIYALALAAFDPAHSFDLKELTLHPKS